MSNNFQCQTKIKGKSQKVPERSADTAEDTNMAEGRVAEGAHETAEDQDPFEKERRAGFAEDQGRRTAGRRTRR
jgi:hypothetical protein